MVSPTLSPSSYATRFAMLTAASRRGCVQMILTSCFLCMPHSRMYLGTWVVLPQPVSPEMIRTRLRSNLWMICCLCFEIGSDFADSIDAAMDWNKVVCCSWETIWFIGASSGGLSYSSSIPVVFCLLLGGALASDPSLKLPSPVII